MRTQSIVVSGMSGGHCVGTVTQALRAVSGVSAVNVSLETGDATVQFDERMTSTDQLNAAVRAAGFGIGPAS